MIENQPFTNDQIESDNLPSIEHVELEKVDRKYLNALLINKAIVVLIFIGLWLTLYLGPSEEEMKDVPSWLYSALAIFFTLLSGLLILGSFKKYKLMGYALRVKDIIFKEGWLWQSTTTIPFNRVQHSQVTQNPIERFFGLAKLKVFTAGGATSDLSISGLTPETAEKLKWFITNKTSNDEEE